MKKIISFILVLLMSFMSITPTVAMAKNKENSQSYELTELESELEFYFEKVGYIDENRNYFIKNIELLEQRVKVGDKNAEALVDLYNNNKDKSVKKFAICVAKDYLGTYIDLLKGKLWDLFIDYVKNEAWEKAAKLLLKVLGKSTSKANIVANVAELALAAYNCHDKF